MPRAPLRPLREGDLDTALALLRDAAPEPSYADVLASVVESAALAPTLETRGLVAERDGEVAAITVYGEYAGAVGAGRLHFVAVAARHRRHGLGAILLDAVTEELRARAARFILAELPEDRPALDAYIDFLRAASFTEESRVPDFHRPGVALLFLRRDVG